MPAKSSVRQADPVRSAFDIVADVSLQALEDDPYQFYGWMRAEAPIVYVPETGRVLVTTWDLCKEAGANDTVFGPTKEAHETVYGRPNVMSMTGDEHRALRNASRVPVQPKAVKGYHENGIRETVVRYIDSIRSKGAADATLEIFEPISQRVIGDVLGFTDVDDATLSRWFHVYADYLVDYGRDEQVAERVKDVKAEVWDYLEARDPPPRRASGFQWPGSSSPPRHATGRTARDRRHRPYGRRADRRRVSRAGAPHFQHAPWLVRAAGPSPAGRVGSCDLGPSGRGGRTALASTIRIHRETDDRRRHSRRGSYPGEHRDRPGDRLCKSGSQTIRRPGGLRHRPRRPRQSVVRLRLSLLHRPHRHSCDRRGGARRDVSTSFPIFGSTRTARPLCTGGSPGRRNHCRSSGISERRSRRLAAPVAMGRFPRRV